jgi:putative ABC transport system ATP-binding protein
MRTPILQLDNIQKTFQAGTANENYVLKELSLTVYKGDYISFIGGNGSGKSTLLNSIAGVFPIDAGEMSLEGEDLKRLSEEARAKDIARVFQDPMMGTAPRMTVAENLAIALNRGDKRGFGRTLNAGNYQYFEELLSNVGLNLEEKLNTEVGLLSGGQRQVIALLMATIKKPKLLLLDEHVAALDPKATEQVMETTEERIHEEEITSLMVTHNMQHALDYGNRLVMMDEGRIVIDVAGEEKRALTVPDLINLFHKEAGKAILTDQMLL